MADIKSALQQALAAAATNAAVSKAIGDWEADDVKTAPTPDPLPTIQEATTMTKPPAFKSIAEQTFNYIRDTPYVFMNDALMTLAAQGHNIHTVASAVYQMIKQGLVSRDMDGKLTALRKQYAPLKSPSSVAKPKKTLKARRTKVAQEARVPVFIPEQIKAPKGIAALNSTPAAAPAQPAPEPAPTPTPTHMTAAKVLETLSIKEAHMLYRELQTMFGG